MKTRLLGSLLSAMQVRMGRSKARQGRGRSKSQHMETLESRLLLTTAAAAAANVSVAGLTTQAIDVTYNSASLLVNYSTLDSNDIRVTGPNGYSQLATFIGADVSVDSATIVARYRINAPSGAWSTAANGTYTISMVANQVTDTDAPAVAVPAGAIGSFTASVTQPYYHAGDLDPTFNTGATPLPGTNTQGGYYTEQIVDGTGQNYVLDMADGFWGYPNMVRSVFIPAKGNTPAKYVVANGLSGHIQISRYLADGAVDAYGDPDPNGSMFDPTFNGGVPLTLDLGTYGLNREETLGGITVQSDGKIIIAGTTRQYGPNVGTITMGSYFDVNSFVARIDVNGTLDTTYDKEGKVDGRANDGIVVYDFASGQEEIASVVVMPGDKVVIGGSTTLDPGTAASQALLVEFNPDGTINNSFGANGRAVNTLDQAQPPVVNQGIFYWMAAHYYGGEGWANRQYDDRISAMVVQADGKLVVGGSVSKGTATDTEWVIARFKADGSLDTTFGTNGVTVTDITAPNGAPTNGCGEDAITAMAIQSDGRIVVAGYSTPPSVPVLGLNSGENWARRAPTHAMLGRYTINGVLDTTFASVPGTPAGTVDATLFTTGESLFNSILIQSDGRIIASGYSQTALGGAFYAARFLPNSMLDMSFGTGGHVITRMDQTTMGDYWLWGDYKNGIPNWTPPTGFKAKDHPAIVQSEYLNALPADDIATDMFIDPRDGTITLVGVSVTSALFQGLSVPGNLIEQLTDPPGLSTPTPLEYDADVPAMAKSQPMPAYAKYGQLEFVRLTNDTPNYQSDTETPMSQLVTPLPASPAQSDATYDFVVLYSDNVALQLTSFSGLNITVTGPNGYSVAAQVVGISSDPSGTPSIVTDQSPVYVKYRITRPVTGWVTGSYTVHLNALSVSDTGGNYAAQGDLGIIPIVVADNDTPMATVTAPPVTTMGGLFYTFTVTYTDNFAINVASIDSQDILVQGPNGFSQVATLVSVDQPLNGTRRVATYRISAPGGNWQPSGAGTYSISVRQNQIGDAAFPLTDASETYDPTNITNTALYPTQSHFVTAGILGTFTVTAPDTTVPTATVLASNVTTTGGTTYLFTVTYQDNVAININSIDSTDITVVGPNNYSQKATLVSVTPSGNGTPRVATYRITPPGGSWSPSNFGVYTITMNTNAVYDTSNNFVAAGTLGTFTVSLGLDAASPTATATASNVITVGGTTQTITVTYTDDIGINTSMLGTGDIQVVGPNGYTQIATFVSVNQTAYGTPRVATYTIVPPGGAWAVADQGTYGIYMQSGRVADTNNNFVANGLIGSFDFVLPDVTAPVANLTAPNVPGPGGVLYTFTVTYTDDVAINVATLGTGDVTVSNSLGWTQTATLVSVDTPTNGTPRTATYQITPPGGAWALTNVGTYTITMNASQVADTSSNFVPTLILGTFTVAGDTVAPTAVLNPLLFVRGASNTFTVTYTDDYSLNVSTLDNFDILVTGPNGYSQFATLTAVDVGTNGTPRTATYSLTGPGGSWSTASNGTYVFALQSNQVADAAGNYAATSTLGTLNLSLADIEGPTATATGTNITLANSSPVAITVTYADFTAINGTTIGADDIKVRDPQGTLHDVTFGVFTPNGTAGSATYSLAAPNGGWTALNNGTWTIVLQAGGVADTLGNLTLQTDVGTFNVAVADGVAPTAALGGGINFTSQTANTFTVVYTDDIYINVSSLNNQDVLVTGPNGFSRLAQFVSATPSTNNASVVATYSITGPNGGWTAVNNGTYTFTLQAAQVTDAGGNFVAGGVLGTTVVSLQEQLIFVAPDRGAAPTVKVFGASSGTLKFSFDAYISDYVGGVRLAAGDFNGDGVTDIVTATGPGGGPLVNVYNGVDGSLMSNFFAYVPDYWGGVQIAVADVTGDGHPDIITSTEAGGVPLVNVFDQYGNLEGNFFAYNQDYLGGVRIAAGKFISTPDNRAQILTATASGGVPLVTIFDLPSRSMVGNFWGLDPSYRGGMWIAAGDVTGDGFADAIVTTDAGEVASVRIFNGQTRTQIREFMVNGSLFTGGVRVASVDANADGFADVVTVLTPSASTQVKIFDGRNGNVLQNYFAFAPSQLTGLFVASY